MIVTDEHVQPLAAIRGHVKEIGQREFSGWELLEDHRSCRLGQDFSRVWMEGFVRDVQIPNFGIHLSNVIHRLFQFLTDLPFHLPDNL